VGGSYSESEAGLSKVSFEWITGGGPKGLREEKKLYTESIPIEKSLWGWEPARLVAERFDRLLSHYPTAFTVLSSPNTHSIGTVEAHKCLGAVMG
jgi:hypothetical protein